MTLKVLTCVLALSTICYEASAVKVCAGTSSQKLDNGMQVVFVDTMRNENVLVMLCIASGSADEFDQNGISNLLNNVIAKKLKNVTNTDALLYGSESSSHSGIDQNVYYFYGKKTALKSFIKNLSTICLKLPLGDGDIKNIKNEIISTIKENKQNDRYVMKHEAKKSIYWHSGYGSNPLGSIENINLTTDDDLETFRNKQYTANRVSFVICGDVNKEDVVNVIKENVGEIKTKSEIKRLEEPEHHGSTVRIEKKSPQVSAPILEIYWKIPNYRTAPEKAKFVELFINHLDGVLQKSLIQKQKLASSISFCYSFWNYNDGDFCIKLVPNEAAKIRELEFATLAEIKTAVKTGITQEEADLAAKKLSDSYEINRRDAIDASDFISKKISAMYDHSFIKEHPKYVKAYSVENINTHAASVFDKDPAVISVMIPLDGTHFAEKKQIEEDRFPNDNMPVENERPTNV